MAYQVHQFQQSGESDPHAAPDWEQSRARLSTPSGETLVLRRKSGWRAQLYQWRDRAGAWFEKIDLAPDLAEEIGTPRWFRGLATLLALGAVSLSLWPGFNSLEAMPAMPSDRAISQQFRSQMIAPLALGADSGVHTAPGRLVTPLKAAPERPRIELVATLAAGDSFGRMLRRAGVGMGDSARVQALLSSALPISEVAPGTRVEMTLGRRAAPGVPRPLDALEFRARFDLALAIKRYDGQLALERQPIRVDDTPLRIEGTVGPSLYRSARAAGMPAAAVQQYLRAIDSKVDMKRAIRANDQFDIIIAYRRAATGERQAGRLLYAGVNRAGRPKIQLMRWGKDGRFYEASGVGEQRGGLVAPVPGRITSRFGMRRHPILGYRRMHSGVDFHARYGTPVVAVADGRIISAGRAGGCGNAVKIRHSGGLATRYCHLSRIAVRSGSGVRQGQVIGYSGSTGLSTGPHLHYEMYRGGRAINPLSVQFVRRAQLTGSDLAQFRRQLARLQQVKPGAALADLASPIEKEEAPKREIDRIESKTILG